MRKIYTACLLSTIFFAVLACEKKPAQQEITQKKQITETISIAFPPEISDLMSKAVEVFHDNKVRLPNGAQISFVREIVPSLTAVQKISRGEIKPNLWVAPFAGLPEFVNKNLKNLGARQVDCKKIFTTGLVATVKKESHAQVFGGSQSIQRSAIVPKNTRHLLNFSRPIYSDSGLAAALYLSKSSGKDTSEVLAESLSNRLFSNPRRLLAGVQDDFFGLARVGLISEQEINQFNKAQEQPILDILYLTDDAPAIEYTICKSEADWITPAQRAAADIFHTHLFSQQVQLLAQQDGYRPVIKNMKTATDNKSSASSETPAAEPTAESASLPLFIPLPLEVYHETLKSQEPFNPKTVTMYVIDSSNAMQGPPFISAKRLIRGVLERETNQSPSGIIAFDSRAQLISEPTLHKRGLFPHLAGLAINTGSSLYDAVLLAAEHVSKEEYNNYQRRIVLITAGIDQGSETPLEHLNSEMEKRLNKHEIELTIMAVPHPEIDRANLKQLAHLVSGSVVDYNSNASLDEFIQTLEQN